MAIGSLAIGIIFSLQTAAGILGNFSLLSHDLYLHFTGCKLRCTDVTIRHLTLANCLVILFRGTPQTMAALGMEGFLSDMGCKLVFYVHRVGRDVSKGSTCLLSVSQAVTISPNNSCCRDLKIKTHRYIGPCNILCWVLNFILNVMTPVHMTGKRHKENITKRTDYGYCSSIPKEKTASSLYISLLFLHDALPVGLMLCASAFMLSFLHRHKQQVRYIRSHSATLRCSPESRAMQSVLILVSVFASLSMLSFILHVCVPALNNPSMWLVHTSAFIAGSFPAVSPYILMSHDSRVPRLCFACPRDAKSSPLRVSV
ncbi:vomeronasal type-1 receptor 4-like [Ochotona curzoniae]|uniref:vomeronasal type-1 receptor 4-like n=1 Tax=Ochotona curzoniae TaxID=130825 RepID=UPI001B34DEB1|nr:vomeronasal type-1 receptor 4-like [Ochotona curzoniae]